MIIDIRKTTQHHYFSIVQPKLEIELESTQWEMLWITLLARAQFIYEEKLPIYDYSKLG